MCKLNPHKHHDVDLQIDSDTPLRDDTKRRSEGRSHLDQPSQSEHRPADQPFHDGVAALAHDLNNILTAVNGTADLLLQSIDAGHAFRPDLEAIRMAGDRAAVLTQQLLSTSRQAMMNRRPCEVLNVTAVIRNLFGVIRGLVGTNIPLTFSVTDRAIHINANAIEFERMILNLVVNARDAMTEGGHLTVATDVVELGSEDRAKPPSTRAGRHVVIAVTDTGMGMDTDTRQRIFEPFFTTKGSKGTGVGLTTVSHIVARCNGFIEVDSEVGVGTTIRVYLPTVD